MTWTGITIPELLAASIGIGICLRWLCSGVAYMFGMLAELFRSIMP